MSFADTGVGGQGPLKVWGYTKFGLGQPRYTMVLFVKRQLSDVSSNLVALTVILHHQTD